MNARNRAFDRPHLLTTPSIALCIHTGSIVYVDSIQVRVVGICYGHGTLLEMSYSVWGVSSRELQFSCAG